MTEKGYGCKPDCFIYQLFLTLVGLVGDIKKAPHKRGRVTSE
ncbi:hypothetical protein C942_03967 [Photobacterium marinum]|uniref:Uncharacterized protein n=1 Tax=Photobacterium marinum TaxID=1056511 RepID=L8J359_9GAMM|nr:hypothetical protein C942_03967 [Photobacterium marinum]